jgi:hypothetical protein
MQHARNINIRQVWPVYSGPSGILRRVGVCAGFVSARNAPERVTTLTIALIDATALRAGSRGISWVHETDGYSRSPGFVGYKGAKLIEGPTVQAGSFAFPSPDPSTDAFEALKGNTASGAFRERDNLFGNCVVDIGRNPTLFQASATQQPFSGACSLFLETLAQALMSKSKAVQVTSAVTGSVRVGDDVYNTKIATQPVKRLSLLHVGYIHRCKEKPLTGSVNQIRFTALKSQKFPLSIPTNKRDGKTTIETPYAHLAFCEVPRKNAFVVGNRFVWTEVSFAVLVQLIRVRNLGIQPHNHLCRKRVCISNLSVSKFVQSVLTELFGIPGYFTKPVTRSIGRLERLQQQLGLFSRWLQFNLDGQFHLNRIILPSLNTIDLKTAFLRQLKQAVSCLLFL